MYGPQRCALRAALTRRSSSRRMPSSGCRPPACAGPTCGPTAASTPITQPTPMGHEYCGIVEEVGSAVKNIKPGQFVVGSFFASDNTCPICQAGYQSRCVDAGRRVRGRAGRAAARPAGRRHAGRHAGLPSDDLLPRLMATSDVLGTGWFAAVAAEVGPGKTVAVVGDGAVGLLGVLAARQLGAERIIAMSRHPSRQKLAREFGATDIVTERGTEGVAKIKQLTGIRMRPERVEGDLPGVPVGIREVAGVPAPEAVLGRPQQRASGHGLVETRVHELA